GSPLRATVRVEHAPLTRVRMGALTRPSAGGQRYDPARTPLEVLVEREPVVPDLRLALAAGLHFLRLLDRHGVGEHRGAWIAAFPLARGEGVLAGAEARRLLRVAHGRAPDGLAVAAAFRSAHGLPDRPTLPDAHRAGAAAAGEEL